MALYIADYILMRKEIFDFSRIRIMHENEVYVSPESCFSFAEARDKVLRNLSSSVDQ